MTETETETIVAPESASATGPLAHSFRTLDRWPQWACLQIIALFAVLPIASAVLLAQDGWVATGDRAVIGIRSFDAWTSDAPLVGQPTTGEETVGIESSHPGPIENWIAGPFVRALGPQLGLLVGIAVINGAALGVTLWLAFRRGGPVLLSLTAVFLALLVHALGTSSLTDAFNSELPTYPTLAAVMAAWSVVQRDLAAAPVLVFAASIAAQPHVVGGAGVILPVLIATGSIVIQLVRHEHRRHEAVGPLLLALALAMACWAPPLAQELSAGPSNVRALTQTSQTSVASIGVAHAGEQVVTALAPPPVFVRAGDSLVSLSSSSNMAVVLAALVLGGAGSLAVLHRQRGSRGLLSLWILATASLVGGAALATRSPVVQAGRIDTNRWLWTSGFLVWLSLLLSIWWSIPPGLRKRAERMVGLVGIVFAFTLTAAVFVRSNTSEVRDARYMAPTVSLNRAVIETVPRGRYLFTTQGSQSGIVVGPALAFALVTDGYELTVRDGGFNRRFGHDRHTSNSAVDGTLLVVDLPAGGRPPEGTLVAKVTIPPDGDRDDGVTIGVVRQ